jgi:hypothetical protein
MSNEEEVVELKRHSEDLQRIVNKIDYRTESMVSSLMNLAKIILEQSKTIAKLSRKIDRQGIEIAKLSND